MNDRSEHLAGVLEFVKGLELPPAPRKSRSTVSGGPQTAFDQVKAQALVVGSDVVSFVAGITPETRKDIVNCTLLAQLAASKRVPNREDIRGWHKAYFETLTHLGWVIQEQGFAEHREAGADFEAHKAILSIATVLLGPAATAFAVVQSTLDAMKSMTKGQWITVFKRESQTAKAARFQVTLAEPTPEGGSMIALMAFELKATATLDQVLFLKFKSSDVTLQYASSRVTINADVLQAARSAIALRVAAFTQDYVASLPI
ncbi:MAG: hypothetical protein KGZ69_12755 [Methylomonas sp.]|nr:hypothetical protein [Methylomonas sp.]